MLKKILPASILLILFSFIMYANVSPNTYLIGWDNLLPELNFALNIKRSIFAVWQEYQGLGLLGGNGHAAELPRQLILFFFSIFFPINFLRQIYIFITLFLGAGGMYLLVQSLLSKKDEASRRHASFIGSMFYLLNLITVQTFYVPFEPFITQYAFLPWLFYATFRYIKKQSLASLTLFIGINICAIPQGQVPTVFFIYFTALCFLLLIVNLASRSKEYFKITTKIITITLLLNAFWLLPFTYFSLTNAKVAFQAKINQEATTTIVLQNKEFGTLPDLLLLKGFWFNNIDPDKNGVFTFMMQPWREWVTSPLIIALGISIFIIALLGLCTILKNIKQNPVFTNQKIDRNIFIGFGIMFLVCAALLLNATPPFSWIDTMLRNSLPLFNQVLRFPFTKLSLLFLLTYALFLSIGIYHLSIKTKKKPILRSLLIILFGCVIILFSFPIFQGKLFYAKEKVALPKEYQQLFAYFEKQDPHTRIANLPQPTFWGWNFTRWGYGGSGFLWYGIRQPILDRAFDVWSQSSENYYYEITQALYARNETQFLNVLNKYQITWLLLDKNIIYPSAPKSLLIPEIKALTAGIPGITREATFGNLEVYKVDLKDKPQNFIFTSDTLPTINNYEWNNHDQAYIEYGNYITENKDGEAQVYYPFRSLLSRKTQNEIDFNLTLEANAINITQKKPINSLATKLSIPQYDEEETIVPVTFFSKTTDSGDIVLSYQVKTPEIWVDNNKVSGTTSTKEFFLIKAGSKLKNEASRFPLKLNLNGVKNFSLLNKTATLGTAFLSLRQNNILTVTDTNALTEGITIPAQSISNLISQKASVINLTKQRVKNISIKIPKINDNVLSFEPNVHDISQLKNCDKFRDGKYTITKTNTSKPEVTLYAKNAGTCISYFSSILPHNQAYGIFLTAKNTSGTSLHFWLENIDQKYASIDTDLPQSNQLSQSTLILPPQDEFGQGYSLHFDNNSIGNSESKNTLTGIAMYPIPYNFLSKIKLQNEETAEKNSRLTKKQDLVISHPNESTYLLRQEKFSPESIGERTIILSQAFNKGWKAYVITLESSNINNHVQEFLPFLFGKEIRRHVQVNNWENGWILSHEELRNKNQELILIYLPQYLEYLGFLIPTIILAISMPFLLRRHHD